ncbi:MAG TPA: VWA domain-containing protein [Blastocatellia bacterium]|nr:VWA domain-containing protein [Blastocatellia bacterium]
MIEMIRDRRWMLFTLAALVLVAAVAVCAQDRRPPDQDEAIRLKADLVTITAAVLDRDGRAVRSLKREDFIVFEDGVEQKIAHFARTEEPFTVMLMLDFSGSTLDEIALMKRAAKKFLAELRKDDRVGVITFSGDVKLVSDFTSDRAEIEAAIESEQPPQGSGQHRFTRKTGTSFYDALRLAVEDTSIKSVEGRKAIVCMSDGVDSTSKSTYSQIATLVEKSAASVYFLELNTEEAMIRGLLKERTDAGYINLSPSQISRYYEEFDRDSIIRNQPRDLMPPEMKRDIARGLYEIARRDMRQLAERTGGRVYPASALTDLSAVYKQVADDLRSQYSIGYYPQNDAHDGGWRSIRIEVRQQGATVRARSGYWAPERRR